MQLLEISGSIGFRREKGLQHCVSFLSFCMSRQDTDDAFVYERTVVGIPLRLGIQTYAFPKPKLSSIRS
jgi:hypothetical protein